MGKIRVEFETEYEKGDVVVFQKGDSLRVGVIEGYYVDDNCVWYNIRINPEFVFTYSNGGDIAEWNIKMKINDTANILDFIIHGED